VESFWSADEIFYGHVLGFKGLERPVVVLAVNETKVGERSRERLYVRAITGAGSAPRLRRPGDDPRNWRRRGAEAADGPILTSPEVSEVCVEFPRFAFPRSHKSWRFWLIRRCAGAGDAGRLLGRTTARSREGQAMALKRKCLTVSDLQRGWCDAIKPVRTSR
jgi:hypothetical protein